MMPLPVVSVSLLGDSESPSAKGGVWTSRQPGRSLPSSPSDLGSDLSEILFWGALGLQE